MKKRDSATSARMKNDPLPNIELTHGRVLWVLEAMGLSSGVEFATFNHYIKSLRKLGVPFGRGEAVIGVDRLARYTFYHLVELCLALSLRVYGILPDSVICELRGYRRELYAMYRRAYLEHQSGLGAPVRVISPGFGEFGLSGVHLDLQIRVSGGRAVEFGPPRSCRRLRLFDSIRASRYPRECTFRSIFPP